tara:strand:+ start:2196 stop:2552 length:357 start_codon:yes stop_codon:yes gene_type:complete
MKLNIINNYKALYYNLLSNFYLILNCFLPFYDEVIISMHNEATKSLFGDINTIKQLRMMELLNKLENNDKIILNKNNNTILVEYNCCNNLNNNTESSDSSEFSDNEVDLNIETSKKYN